MTPPLSMLKLGAQWTRIAMESQRIIALRVMGMAGILPAAADEGDRMVREKWQAAFASGLAAGLAMQRGAAPVAIALAATAPVARKTRANLRRLG
jgi:hypothetical protein